jgi:hypothetical protein
MMSYSLKCSDSFEQAIPSKPKHDVQIPLNPKPEAFWDFLEPIFAFPKENYLELVVNQNVGMCIHEFIYLNFSSRRKKI